jgi:hypothetical protein
MTGHFEQIGSLSGVRDQDAAQEISSVRGDIFGEDKRGADDVLVEEVNVVAFGVGWIIVKGKVTCEHRVLDSC